VDAISFTHTDVKNDGYVAPADRQDPDILDLLQAGDYGDTAFTLSLIHI